MREQEDIDELARMHLIAFAVIGLSGAFVGAALGVGIALWWMC